MNIYERAIKEYGFLHQIDLAIEECSELIKELCKYKRYGFANAYIEEEVADVEIMLEQLKIMFNNDEVKRYKDEKLKRLQETIESKKAP